MNRGLGLRVERIFLYQDRCDMRRSFDRLAGMIQNELGENPLSGDLFVFLNGTRRMLKVLYWDHDGYAIWYKRLEKGKFLRPQIEGVELSRTSWILLLEGIEARIIRKQPRYHIGEKKE